MAITLTISDSQDTQTYTVIAQPLVSSPIINERDVETLDGNISTYYSSTKQALEVNLAYMTENQYKALVAFRDRQYQLLKYPTITISGAENIKVDQMTMKLALNEQRIVCRCGVVEEVVVTLRESKQL